MVPFLCRWAGGPEVYKFLAVQLESGSKQASPGFGSRFLPQFLLDYTYKPQFVIMDLKVPDCGFNHSHITVDFYLQKDKTFVGWGKDGFGVSPWKIKIELSGNGKLKINMSCLAHRMELRQIQYFG